MLMTRGNLIALPNTTKKDNNIGKTVCERTGSSGRAFFTLFAVTTLGAAVSGSFSAYNHSEIPYIECRDYEQERNFAGLESGIVIDLLKAENLNKLEKMRLFKDDWNGTGGKAFTRETITFCESLINALRKQPQIAPTGRNSLFMQYELDDKSLLAFEVSERRAEQVYVPRGDYALASSVVYTENICQKIKESVDHFYGFK